MGRASLIATERAGSAKAGVPQLQVRQHARRAAGGVPRCDVPALHRALLPQALAKVPDRRRKRVAAQLKAVHAQELLGAGLRKADEMTRGLKAGRLADATRVIREGVAETLTYVRFPMERWRRIRTNNGIERLNREVKRRTNAVGSFPDGRSAMMLAAARCKYVADGNWDKRRYLDISLLDHWDGEECEHGLGAPQGAWAWPPGHEKTSAVLDLWVKPR